MNTIALISTHGQNFTCHRQGNFPSHYSYPNKVEATSLTPIQQRYPFSWLTITSQRPAFGLGIFLTVILMAAIHVTNLPLENTTAPYGMVSFQLAGNLSGALRILASWNQEAMTSAALNLGIDYLYMVVYSTTIGLGCTLLSRRLAYHSSLLALVGVGLSWGIFAALVLDALENYMLILLLFGDRQIIFPVIARWCAIPKFVIVLAALTYLVSGGVFALAIRSRT